MGRGGLDRETSVEKIKAGLAIINMYNAQNAMSGKPPLVTKEVIQEVANMITPNNGKNITAPTHGL